MAGALTTPPGPLPGVPDALARRLMLNAEARERASGQWSPFLRANVKGQVKGAGWLRDVHSIVKNPWCVLLVRTVMTAWGPIEHCAIRTASEGEMTWKEKQKIKDEVFGPDRVAMEVMPRHDDIVDGANMYHIWVLPPGYVLPFGLNQ